MYKKILPRSEFTKNVLTVLTGTALAQAIPLLISPILTRLFTAEDFGVLFLFTALLAVLSPISTAKYELAVLLPEKDEEAINIVALACLISLFVSTALLAVVVGFKSAIIELLGDKSSGDWLYLLPLSLFLAGLLQAFNYWSNRRKRFGEISVSKVGQSGVTGASNLIIGNLNASGLGLIFSTMIGQVTNILILIRGFIKNDRTMVSCIKGGRIKSQASRYGAFPQKMISANIFNISAAQLPNILLAPLFGIQFLGLYALSQRVVKIPITVMGNAYGEVFKQRAAEIVAKGDDVKPLFWKSLLLLSLGSLPFFIIFYQYAPQIFSFVFGEEWRVGGDYARILTPYFYLAFVTAPLTHLFYILERTGMYLLIQASQLIAVLGALYYGYANEMDPASIVASLSVAYAVIYLIMLLALVLIPGRK
ncbi:lipopolysaccharide biosynthesis protein [Flavobacteriales bacterium AH-315-E23]|nr:lipopolysaccharide biosynthesis protein [Flavobacteriales bacterium AH-315-E23]